MPSCLDVSFSRALLPRCLPLAAPTSLGGARMDVVIGVSFGGFVAQRFAAEHPDLMHRLVLLVSAHRFSEDGRAAMERQFKSLETGDFHSLISDNVLLFRRSWYNWIVRLKLWKDRDRLASDFKDPELILRSYRSLFSEDFERNRGRGGRCRGVPGRGAACIQPRRIAEFQGTLCHVPACRSQTPEGMPDV
jgi:pimeloyl-ACP methyl ester carboxylesterase